MEIYFKDNKLKAAFEDETKCRRRFGTARAKVIQRRLPGLRAAESLADFWPPKSGPERCHELEGPLAGTFSIDVNQLYRLLFVPIEAGPTEEGWDERERWRSITSIEIVGVEDTHG